MTTVEKKETGTTSQVVYVNAGQSNGLWTTGFVFALLAIFLWWVPVLWWILWILWAIFSFVGIFKAPRGLAIAGLIISFIDLILLLTVFGALLKALF